MEKQLVKSGTSLALTRVFQAPLARLYQAWTDPEMMGEWFHPNPEMRSTCTVDLRVGGRYEIRMYPQEGDPYVAVGEYQEIIPNEKLVFTWRWQGVEDAEESLVTVLFRSLSERETELTLQHKRFLDEEDLNSHAEGWAGTFDQLAAALE